MNSDKNQQNTTTSDNFYKPGYETPYTHRILANTTNYCHKFYLFRAFNNYIMETKSLFTSFFVEEDQEMRFIEAARLRNVKNSKI